MAGDTSPDEGRLSWIAADSGSAAGSEPAVIDGAASLSWLVRPLRWSLPSVSVPVLFAALIAILTVHLAAVLKFWFVSLRFPFGLDYGEGIVWQQALLIPSTRMYGDITHFPYIVFHYPPLYHLAVRAIASFDVDWLMAGRGLSMAAALAIGALAAALTYHATRNEGRMASATAASIAGLITFTYLPLVIWAALMRVDMFAIALSFAGVYCAVRSLERPWLLYCAMVLFVAAVYTKQTEIAAPLATLTVLFVIEPRRTSGAIGFGITLAISALALMEWRTDGGFLRHIMLYNINRYSFPMAVLRVAKQAMHALYFRIALAGVVGACRSAMRTDRQAWRTSTGCIPIIFALYFVISTAMLATVGKSGAMANYFIEWMCVWSVLIGVFVAPVLAGYSAQPLPAFGLAAALLFQVAVLPVWLFGSWADPAEVPVMQALVDKIKAASAPVSSDDMILLMRAGKPVPWEPAIFAQLTATGAWDQTPLVAMVRRHAFAFLVTAGQHGDALYDDRYSPELSTAIETAYPRIERYGRLMVHLPPA
jgi:hypothetical protein